MRERQCDRSESQIQSDVARRHFLTPNPNTALVTWRGRRRTKNRTILWTLALLLAIGPRTRAQDYGVCQRIIDTGLREYDIQKESQVNLISVYDNYCSADGSTKTANFGGSLDAVVKAIPIGLKVSSGSAEEQMHSFCRLYSETRQNVQNVDRYKETIASRAYDSFDSCIYLVSKGVSITHNVVSKTTTSFFLMGGATQSLEVHGVTAKNAACTGQKPGSSIVLTYGTDTNVKVPLPGGLGFTCEREVEKTVNGKTVYKEGSITITTNLKNYDVFLPRDEREPEDLASNIQTSIQSLQARIERANFRIDGITISLTPEHTISNFACSGTSRPGDPGGMKELTVMTGFMAACVTANPITPNAKLNAAYGKELELHIPPR